jgi:hypothetical protein
VRGASGQVTNPLHQDTVLQKKKAQDPLQPPSAETRKEPKILDPRKVKWMAAYENNNLDEEEDESGFVPSSSVSNILPFKNTLKKSASDEVFEEFSDSNTLKIEGFSAPISLELICSYFSAFGSITSIKQLNDCVVILAFGNKSSASNAIKYMDGKLWNDQTLHLSRARPIDSLDDVLYGTLV